MKRCALAVALLALTGCGTVQNFTQTAPADATVYGGGELAAAHFNIAKPLDGVTLALFWPVYGTDVVCSAVGDTLTLPVTIPLQVVRAINAHYFPPDKPQSNTWREFWFNDPNAANLPEAQTPPASQAQ
jgi:hypothetical protein